MRRLRLTGWAAAAVVTLSGCGGGGLQSASEPPSPQAPSPTAVALAAPTVTPRAPRSPRPKPVQPRTPTRLRLGDVDAQVVPVAMEGSALTPPDDPRVLGWWGRPAGASRGVTLLVGHTVHTGGGALDDLENVPIGTRASVSGVDYVVTQVLVLSKEDVSRRAERLFDQSGTHRLVVVTCEDYDAATGHYDSNVVLIARRGP